VTFPAFDLAVPTVEQEARRRVIEIPSFPGTGGVAGFAFLAITSLVLVVLFVTTVTGQRCILEGGRQVAFFAFDLGVTTGQCEARLVVIEGRVLPFLFVVATLTFVAELAFVLVVLLVASNTGLFQPGFVDIAFLGQMTGVALGLPVLALEQVFGFLVVIEDVGLPVLSRMTRAAFLAVAALVAFFVVILAVTGDAGGLHLQFRGFWAANTALMAGVVSISVE